MKKKNNLKEFKNIYKLVKEDRYKLLFAFILIFISSMLSITNGWLQGNIAESIIALNIKGALLFLSAYFIIGVFFNNILEGFGVKIASKIEANISNKLSVLVYKKTLNLPAYAFEEKSSGELINRITSDTETLSDTFNSSISKLITFFVLGISTSSKKKLILSSTSGTSVNSVSSSFLSCDFNECIFFFKT